MKNDPLGERQKSYEKASESRLINFLPVYARIDGRKFSKYTKGFDKPFDAHMSKAMAETTKHLVKNTHADFGYTQSDEISLFWTNEKLIERFLFGGRISKLNSVLAGMASAKFIQQAIFNGMPHDSVPHFDSRVCQMPSQAELYNMLVWRQQDCTRNAVTSVAHSMFGHKKIYRVSDTGRREMIEEESGETISSVIGDKYLYGNGFYKELYTNTTGETRSGIVEKAIPWKCSDQFKDRAEGFQYSIQSVVEELKGA